MSKPIPLTSMKPLSFAQRLKRVQAEVRARVATVPTAQQNYVRTRLWSSWIQRNYLPMAPQPTGAVKYPYVDNAPAWEDHA